MDNDTRADMIAGLRAVADWLESHPDVPLPYSVEVFYSVLDNEDEPGIGRIRQIAAAMGVKATEDRGAHDALASFGKSVSYRAMYIHKERRDRSRAAMTYYRSVEPEAVA